MKKILFVAGALILIIITALFLAAKGCARGSSQQKNEVDKAALISQAAQSENKGDFLSAQNAYQELINNAPSSSNEMANWQKKSEELNMKLLFSPVATPQSILYEIKPGDTIVKIAREFKTTPELIARANSISGDKIFPGRKIKVWNTPFSITVDKSQNILLLKSDEEVIKAYIVSTGANNSTPAGAYKIVNKLQNPTWFKAGAVVPASSPENVLGTRWLGFNFPGYGIHGTIEPQNLGKQVTQGCVRMNNSDVEELYTIVPVGTEVTIVD